MDKKSKRRGGKASRPPLPERAGTDSIELLVTLALVMALTQGAPFAIAQSAAFWPGAARSLGADWEGLATAYRWGLAAGGLGFGIVADWLRVRPLYAGAVLGWSLSALGAAWFGLAGTLPSACHFLMGLFGAAQWPCVLRTTQRLFAPERRCGANAWIVAGGAAGALVGPFVPRELTGLAGAPPLRAVWLVSAAGGVALASRWWRRVSDAALDSEVEWATEAPPRVVSERTGAEAALVDRPFRAVFWSRRWWLLLLMVLTIHTSWQVARIWIPEFLRLDHGYSETYIRRLLVLFQASAVAGALVAGAWTAVSIRRRGSVLLGRRRALLVFALLASLLAPAAILPRGPWLTATLLLVGFGTLGMFPLYFTLTQELSARHQGKVAGSLAVGTWGVLAFAQTTCGELVERYASLAELVARHPLFSHLGLNGLVSAPWARDFSSRSCILIYVGVGPPLIVLALRLAWGRRRYRYET